MKKERNKIITPYYQSRFKDLMNAIDTEEVTYNKFNIENFYNSNKETFKSFKDYGYYSFNNALYNNEKYYMVINLIEISEDEEKSIKLNNKIMKNITLIESVYIDIDVLHTGIVNLNSKTMHYIIVLKQKI